MVFATYFPAAEILRMWVVFQPCRGSSYYETRWHIIVYCSLLRGFHLSDDDVLMPNSQNKCYFDNIHIQYFHILFARFLILLLNGQCKRSTKVSQKPMQYLQAHQRDKSYTSHHLYPVCHTSHIITNTYIPLSIR